MGKLPAAIAMLLSVGSSVPLLPVVVRAQTGQPLPAPTTTVAQSTAQPRFRCELNNGRYTVMYYPESRPNRGFAWAIPGAMGGGWSPERRCFEISRRLEEYRPDGLVEMQTGIENGYNIVCATTDRTPACRIIFTVPRGQDPIVTRDSVFQNLLVADGGQSTQGVNTFAAQGGGLNQWANLGASLLGNRKAPLFGGAKTAGSFRNQGINLKPFLDPADGGTGKGLQTQRSTPRNLLNLLR